MISIFSLLFATLFAFAAEFPMGPDLSSTPGKLCESPDTHRYPEQIPYCERNVSTGRKSAIFAHYRKLGFTLNIKNRADYKIDHYIPLCAGGSNADANLWPQHKTIFAQTDTLEALGCEKLAAGRILQKDLVALIRKAKTDLATVPEVLETIEGL